MKTTLALTLLGSAPLLTGCLSTTRHVQVIQTAPVVQNATLDDLVSKVDSQFNAIKTLNASVVMAVSTGGARTGGEVKDYTTVRGYILVRKPEDLRVILLTPVISTRMMDMVSNGQKFTLLMATPSRTRALTGTDVVTTPSKNPLENLRPGVFFDALLVRSILPDEFVTLTESARTLAPETKHHEAIMEPDYDVTVLKHKSGKTLERLRVIHISRVDLEPYQQDIYDQQGRLVTTVQYSAYQKFGELRFPTQIVINRPLDEYTVKITVQKLTPNQEMEDNQFELELPAGVTIETIK
jgi:outer membrane lipoprotein-sorting protein